MSRKTRTRTGGLVYSTEYGSMCPTCRKPKGSCSCRKQPHRPPSDGVVRVGRQTKGRKGKGVTLITGVPLDSGDLVKLGSRLKKMCGSGGTIKDGVIEIQGDHRELLVGELNKQGWTVKKSGG